MNNIKVLLPTLITSNPYIFELIRSLQIHPDIEVVQYGVQWMKDDKYKFDIVHIQWPEVLFEWKEPDQKNVKFLEQTLEKWKKENTKIVSTVHNTFPHKRANKFSKEIYKLVYNNSDAIIHLGDASINFIEQYLDENSSSRIQQVIPHGNYQWFDNTVNKQQARDFLEIDSGKFMMLATGAIRDIKELDLLNRVAEHLETHNGILFTAGRLPKISKKSSSYYTKLLPFLRKKNSFIKDGFIPDDDMQYYLNACDALLIPRLNSLNSGNVALGFTFGKVVIGCDYGVIGDELKKIGNPVFKPDSDSSLQTAIEQAYQLSKSDLGKSNRQYALKEMNWNRVANMHVETYKKLLQLD